MLYTGVVNYFPCVCLSTYTFDLIQDILFWVFMYNLYHFSASTSGFYASR